MTRDMERMLQQHKYANRFDLTGVEEKRRRGISTEHLPPKRESEIIWLNDPTFAAPTDVHEVVVVEDVLSAIPAFLQQDYTLAIAPFAIAKGRGVVLQHTSGMRVCLLDLSQESQLPTSPLQRKLCARRSDAS